MDVLVDLVGPIATVLVLVVAAYAYLLAVVGRGARIPTQPPTQPLLFIILVPCLNEGAVIGRTIASLAALAGRHHVVVVDDDSNDGSQDVIRGFPGWQVTLVERTGTDSRIGKGAALNDGLREALSWGILSLYPRDRIVVAVFDSDSLVSPDFLQRVTPYFADPGVVGVQSGVRMFNAGQNLLTYWQHLEFVLWARIFSRAKDRIGSATLGGNGQCVRLSALLALGPRPWRASLTEDLDLSLRLILNGGRIRFCGEAIVYQEALAHLRPLIRQRARWMHGHLVNWEHVTSVLRSPVPLRARLDLVLLLLLPAALGPVAIATVEGWRTFIASLGDLSFGPLIAWYVLVFAPAPLMTWALRREGAISRREAVFQAHRFLAYTMFWTVAAARAVWRILRGDRSWAKTSRATAQVTVGGRAEPHSLAIHPGRSSAQTWRARLVAGAIGALVVLGSSAAVFVAASALAETYQDVTGGVAPDTGGVLGATGTPVSTSADPSLRGSAKASLVPDRLESKEQRLILPDTGGR